MTAATAARLAVFCCLALTFFCPPRAEAAAPMMALPGQMNVDAQGAFTYAVPIEAAPGTGGMAPHLALTYSSKGGDGIVGLGWSVSGLSAITRCPQTWAQDGQPGGVTFTPGDRFCLDGQRLIVVSGNYGANGSQYRTEIESFRKIVFHTTGTNCGVSCFDVWTKDGADYEFGYTQNANGNASGAQITLDGNTGVVRVWALNQVTSTTGNYIAYSYQCLDNCDDYVPTSIDYTGNAGQGGNAPYNSITFDYKILSQVSNLVPTYQAGYPIERLRLLTDIVTHRGGKVLDYNLAYNTTGSNAVSHNELNAITLCNGTGTCASPCNGASNCIASTTFLWQGSETSPAVTSEDTNLPWSPGWTYSFADFNGDGLTDALIQTTGGACVYGGDILYGSQPGTSFTSANMTAAYDEYYTGTNQVDPYSGAACFENGDSVPADIKGDGISDLGIDVNIWVQGYGGHWVQEQSGEILANEGTLLKQVSKDGIFQYPAVLQTDGFPSDFNNDGLADAVAGGYLQYGNGNGTFTQGPAQPVAEYFLDFDGDGCTDFLDQSHTNTITYSPACNPAAASASIPNFNGYPLVFGDFNGDQKTDVLVADTSGATVYLSTGTGLVKQFTVPNSGSWWSTYTIVAGDWNGDGKSDIALIPKAGGTAYIYLSTGSGFTLFKTLSNFGAAYAPVVADLNNDGAADISNGASEVLFAYTPELMSTVSNGIGATTTVSYDRLNHATIYTKGSGAVYPMQDVDAALYAVSEVQTTGGGTSKSWSYAYTGLERDLHGRGLLGFRQIAITDQQTGIVRTIEYGGGGAAGMAFPQNAFVTSDTLTSGATTLNAVSNTWQINNSSVCPNLNNNLNYVVCLQQRVVSGTDLDGTDNWPTTTTNYTYDGYGNVLTKSASVNGGVFSSLTTNTWNFDQKNGSWIVDEPATSQTENKVAGSDMTRQYAFYEKNGDTGEVTEADIEPEDETNQNDPRWLIVGYGHDSWGNVSSTEYTGWNIVQRTSGVTYDANGEFPILTTNALGQTESPVYSQDWGGLYSLTDLNGNTTNWRYNTFGQLQTLTRVDGTTANETYYYCTGVNGGAYTCPSAGAFVAVTQNMGAPVNGTAVQNAPTTLVFYDALGRVIAQDTQAFDGNWNQTDTEYDSNGDLAATSQPYETVLGQPQCPSNGECTTYKDDILGRVQTASYPNDDNGTSTVTYTYEGLTSIVTNDLQQSTTTLKNAQGLVASVMDANGKVTSYSYDAFGDPLSVSTPNNANQIVNKFDVRGRKLTSTDLDMGSWSYGYDSLSELVSQISPVEYANGQSTTLGYDVLGRLASRTEPDMASAWSYDQAANGVGLPYQATCQAGQSGNACAGGSYTRTYGYDGFSRPSTLNIDTPSLGSVTSTEAYDGTSGNGTGTGHLTTVTAFSGFQYTNGYNAIGYLSQIADTKTAALYWTANTMDAYGHLTQETAGNGVATNRGYWPASGRVKQIEAATNAQPPVTIASLSYYWDTIGNLTYRGDALNGVAENFCYLDNAAGTANVLNRLSGYSVGGTSCSTGSLVKTMSYDNDGDIASKSDVGGYTYGTTAGPHAVTSIQTGAGVNIDGVTNPDFVVACPPAARCADRGDADGNMLCVTATASCATGAGRSYAWTSFDMAATVGQGSGAATFAYDPEHNRGALTQRGYTTWYLNNPAAGLTSEMFAGASASWRDYLMAYGHIVAERFANGSTVTLSYFVGDHLSSTTALTDAGENSQEYDSWDAWGKRRNADGSDAPIGCLSTHPSSLTLRGYTGEEMMDSFCLVNLNARLYDPAIGRMLSADSMVPDAMDGQSYNRYSYVRNRPLSVTDPSGNTDSVDGKDPPVPIICIECIDGDGMPCWGCSGPGIDTVAQNGQVLSAEGVGAFNEFTSAFNTVGFSANGAYKTFPTGELMAGVEWAETQFGDPQTFDATFNFQFPQLGAQSTNWAAAYGVGLWSASALGGEGGPNASMSVDAFGAQFIQGNEGFGRSIYDSNGKGDWTIGWGHAVRGREHGIYDSATLTNQQAQALFQLDLNIAETAVRNNIQYSLTQNQFDALTDFAFNIGSNGFANSYTVSLLNSYSSFGDLMYAEEIWAGAFGNTGRREDEIVLYNSPDD